MGGKEGKAKPTELKNRTLPLSAITPRNNRL